jgi:hypothetical protein
MVIIALGVTVVWHAPLRRPAPTKPEVVEWVVLPPVGATRAARPPAGAPPRRVTGLVAPQATSKPADVPIRAPNRLPAADAPAGELVPGPRVGDGRVWVTPRPALPGDVAERLYGDTTPQDAAAVARLHAMLDSLNRIIDMDQRARRRPSWGTELGGIPFSLDSAYINVAGIKIPTMALSFLGNLLPPGNYDAALRERQLQDMRADLLRAAARTETFRDFQRYVKELRARKQAERDADRRRRQPPDTTRVIP